MTNVVELFAGGGGMAIGFEDVGLNHLMLVEKDKSCVETLRTNRPDWVVRQGDIQEMKFDQLHGIVDVVAGGPPCQSFSFAGNGGGLEDLRGQMIYEYFRVVRESRPKMFVLENVAGLKSHDKGRTLNRIIDIIDDMGYRIDFMDIVNALGYDVPQKRKRLFIVGIRKDIEKRFEFPSPFAETSVLKDALKAGSLYDNDVCPSDGYLYSEAKRKVMTQVPPGGCWRDLPEDVAKEYMGKSYYNTGGRTGIARRIAWDEPCLTLLTSPSQKQTDRCHPDFVRPFTINEYARIQTFPDQWVFQGSTASKYRQIGNAVPVNLAYYIGKSIKQFIRR